MPGTQESKAPTPLLRQSGSRNLKKTKGKQQVFKGAAEYKAGSEVLCLAPKTLCRDLSRAAGGLVPSVSTSVSKRFEAFQGRLVFNFSRPPEASQGPSEALVFARITL